jgi:hypothetical protein
MTKETTVPAAAPPPGQSPGQASGVARLERVLIGGDLSALSEHEQLIYYRELCDTVGLNPLTKPFEYLRLSGKLVLYATKNACEQLRAIHGDSISLRDSKIEGGVFMVTAKAV